LKVYTQLLSNSETTHTTDTKEQKLSLRRRAEQGILEAQNSTDEYHALENPQDSL